MASASIGRRNSAPQLALANAVTALGLGIAVPVTATATGAQGPLLGLVVGAFAGLTFSVTTLVQHNGFEQKSPRLTLINAGYQLVLFVGVGARAGVRRPANHQPRARHSSRCGRSAPSVVSAPCPGCTIVSSP